MWASSVNEYKEFADSVGRYKVQSRNKNTDMSDKDLNGCAQLLTGMLHQDKDTTSKTKRKIASGKSNKPISASVKCKINKDRKPKLPAAARRKPMKAQHGLVRAKPGIPKNKQKQNTVNSKQNPNMSDSLSSYEVFKRPANVPEPLNDTDKVQQFKPESPEQVLRTAGNIQQTRTPFNNRLVSSTPTRSPVSLRVVGKEKVYTTDSVPILQRSPPKTTGTACVRAPSSGAGQYPVPNYSMYSSSTTGSSYMRNYMPSTGLLNSNIGSRYEIPTRDTLGYVPPLTGVPPLYSDRDDLYYNQDLLYTGLSSYPYASQRNVESQPARSEYQDTMSRLKTLGTLTQQQLLSSSVPAESLPGEHQTKQEHSVRETDQGIPVVTSNDKPEIATLVNTGVNTSAALSKPPPDSQIEEKQDIATNTTGSLDQLKDAAINTTNLDKPNNDVAEKTVTDIPTQQTTPRSQEGTELMYTDPKSKEHIQRLRHLLGELRVVVEDDKEAARLVNSLTSEFDGLLPGDATSLQWQAELNMALQPIRNENAELRRRVRILNHQLLERERLQKSIAEDRGQDFDVVHMQLLNHSLEQQLSEEKKLRQRLNSEHQLLKEELIQISQEKKDLLRMVEDRDNDILRSTEDKHVENRQLKLRLAQIENEMSALRRQLNVKQHEVNMNTINLTQRDKEIHRLQALVRSLHQSMTKLMHDLENCKPLSRAPWAPTMDNLSKIQQLLNESQIDRNEVEAVVHNTVVPISPAKKGQTSPSHHPTVEHAHHSPADAAVSLSDRVAAALNSLPNPATTSTSSHSSTLTQERLRHHDQQFQDNKGTSVPYDRQFQGNKITGVQFDNEHTHEDHLLDNYTISTIPAATDNHTTRDKHQTELESFAETDYLLPTGFSSPIRKLTSDVKSSDKENGPTVRDLLSSLATRWQKSANGEIAQNEPLSTQKEQPVDNFSKSWPVKNNVKVNATLNDTAPSVEQSRYSVTDYFKKYHKPTDKGNKSVQESRNSTMISEKDETLEFQPLVPQKPESDLSLCDSTSQVSDITVPSVAPSCTSTVDEQAFWDGLDKLDADIAKVQQSLKLKMQS